jgi:PAS domain-containing protein
MTNQIFVSDEFLKLTEYRREEVIGRNCRFLQGPGTDRSTVQKIRDAVDTCNDITVQLLNYTKTGNTFFIACLLCAKTNVPRFYLESLR